MTEISKLENSKKPKRSIWRWIRFMSKLTAFSIVLLLILRELFFSGSYLVVEKSYESPIFDMHCHTAGVGAGGSGCFVSKELKNNFRFKVYLKAFGVTLPEIEAKGDKVLLERLASHLKESRRVGAAIILAMDGVIDDRGNLDREKTEFFVPNEFVAKETSKYSNLYFGASVNPNRPDALDRLQWAKDNGALLI